MSGLSSNSGVSNGLTNPSAVQHGKIVIIGATVAGSFILPPNAYLQQIIVVNNTANAITGGLKIGTIVGGADVVVALAVGANANTFVFDASLLKKFFTITQTIFYDAVTLWNSANINITVIYGQL